MRFIRKPYKHHEDANMNVSIKDLPSLPCQDTLKKGVIYELLSPFVETPSRCLLPDTMRDKLLTYVPHCKVNACFLVWCYTA